jgi:hypothetical protein
MIRKEEWHAVCVFFNVMCSSVVWCLNGNTLVRPGLVKCRRYCLLVLPLRPCCDPLRFPQWEAATERNLLRFSVYVVLMVRASLTVPQEARLNVHAVVSARPCV